MSIYCICFIKRKLEHYYIKTVDIYVFFLFIYLFVFYNKWPDKSTTSYNMLDFKSYLKKLYGKYLVIERHMLQIQGILLQYLKLNKPICLLKIFYITFKI